MFKTIITKTDFVNANCADDKGLFGNIIGNSYGGDISFVSTLRALLHNRIPETETLRLIFDVNTPRGITEAYIKDYADGLDGVCGVLRIFFVPTPEDMSVYEKLSSYAPGWHRLEKVTAFFRKQMKAVCFINQEQQSTLIFVDTLNIPVMHYLQCGIFAYLPWYFDAEKGASELEMELINSLREKTPDKYLEVSARMADDLQLDKLRVKQLLKGFETAYERAEMDRVKANIMNIVSRINSCMTQMGDYLKQKNDYDIKLLGLEAKIAQGGEESEIQDFFLCNRKVILEDVIGTQLVFGVRDYLTYFDEDRAKAYIENFNSSMYRFANTAPKEGLKKLYQAIFIDQSLKIKFCACYNLRMDGSVSPCSDYNFGPQYLGYKPNPHINRFSCMGDYSRTVAELLRAHNHIGAIEQCIASCRSLNFGDPTVLDYFMSSFVHDIEQRATRAYIELPDGTSVSPAEAMNYINTTEEEQNG